MPWRDRNAQWWYLLAKCSIREWVSACGNIGEEAGLEETYTVRKAWQFSLKARAWRGCPGLVWAEKSQGQAGEGD